MTNNTLPVEHYVKSENRPPATIIPMHPGPRETPPGPRGEKKMKIETGPPHFYTRPIFKTRKHDML
jgi:hypothetical protein